LSLFTGQRRGDAYRMSCVDLSDGILGTLRERRGRGGKSLKRIELGLAPVGGPSTVAKALDAYCRPSAT
jgi:hypothetical protein